MHLAAMDVQMYSVQTSRQDAMQEFRYVARAQKAIALHTLGIELHTAAWRLLEPEFPTALQL